MLEKLKSLRNHQGFLRYFKNTSWLIAEKILRMTVGLFIGIWVARYLGPERFGILSYAISFVGLFSAFATLGLDSIVVRELVKDSARRDYLMGTSFLLKIFGSITILIMLAFFVQFTNNDKLANSIIFIIASATILQSFYVIDFYFQSNVLSKYVVYTKIFSLFISSIIKVSLILNEAPLIFFAWLILFDAFVIAFGYIFYYKRQLLSLTKWRFDTKTALTLLKDSWPLFLSSIAVSVYMQIDQVMIKEMISSDAVGQYAAAVKLCNAWYFIPMVVASSLFPAIINAKKKSNDLYYARLQKLYDLLVIVAIVIALSMTFFGEWLVRVLFGEQFHEAGGVLIINTWASIFVFLTVASGKYLTVENMTKKIFYRNFLGVIVNISLNIIVIPRYGIHGAAFATLISWFFSGYLYDLFDKEVRVMFLQKTRALNIFRLLILMKGLRHG